MKEDRIIIHVDMDAFYASVEMRDNENLRGKPLIIGAMPNERGVVATCNYEARKYGVRSAMNIKEAFRRCSKGIFMHPNFDKYREVSNKLHEILESYTDITEYIALDEGYLDLTNRVSSWEEACEIARLLKERIRKELGLTCSVGVAYSKTAAKTASEEKKPDGFFEIPNRDKFIELMSEKDVRALYTVGEKTAQKLYSFGIKTVRDLQSRQGEVIRLMGQQGRYLADLSFGIDDRKVTPYRQEDTKSISKETTFQEDVFDFTFLEDVLFLLALRVANRAKKLGLYGEGVSLKITYSNMKTITRSALITGNTGSAYVIYENALKLLGNVPRGSVRLIGTGLYHMCEEDGRQLCFMDVFSQEKDLEESLEKNKWEKMAERYKMDLYNNREKLLKGEGTYTLIEEMRKQI